MDMLVSLTSLPQLFSPEGTRIVRVLPCDRGRMLAFVEAYFPEWVGECEAALCRQPTGCFAALRGAEVIGFACYDATAKGFFGPIGVKPDERHGGTGRALLLHCLHAMAWDGYGYAVIGWCDEAADFYARTVGAMPIPDSAPAQSVYGRLFHQPKSHEE